jgi:hypothetical protein
MRLWSLHPKHLDAKGLVALWREGLLAKHVLENKTKGYKNHPQLDRFKSSPNPIESINYYLYVVWKESHERKYNFDLKKLQNITNLHYSIPVNSKQILFEKEHLEKKIKDRSPDDLFRVSKNISVHPLFIKKTGPIETWEKV